MILCHYDVSVSYISRFMISPILLFRPPITKNNVPINRVLCWQRSVGLIEPLLQGAFIQSIRPSLCFLNPHVSDKGEPSEPLPPKITSIPLAVPVLHILAEWYTRGAGLSPPTSTFFHQKWLMTSLTQTSLTDSAPVFPP